MRPIQLICLAGSARCGSYNRQLIDIGASLAKNAGADVNIIDWAAFSLPLYSADLEAQEGFPAGVLALRAAFASADGWLISTPEYNGSIPALLKNAIDWLSRPDPGENPLALRMFRNKVAGLLSASPGAFGGLRSLTHLGYILSGLAVMVLPGHVAVPFADRAFAADGTLQDAMTQSAVADLVERVLHYASATKTYLARGAS